MPFQNNQEVDRLTVLTYLNTEGYTPDMAILDPDEKLFINTYGGKEFIEANYDPLKERFYSKVARDYSSKEGNNLLRVTTHLFLNWLEENTIENRTASNEGKDLYLQ